MRPPSGIALRRADDEAERRGHELRGHEGSQPGVLFYRSRKPGLPPFFIMFFFRCFTGRRVPETHAARVLGFVETFTNTASINSSVAVAPSGTVWEATNCGVT